MRPIEVSTDRARQDVDAIHAYLTRSYWAEGVTRERVAKSLERSLCFGLFDGARQIGFARVVTDATTFAYLADVYVLEEYRGRRLGEELVREMVENGPYTNVRWILHTTNMHALYRKFGFEEPDYKVMERRPIRNSSESG